MLLILPIGDNTPRRSIPVANYLLLAANIFLFFYVLRSPIYHRPEIYLNYGLIPADFNSDPLGNSLRLLTSLFLHGGIAHLVGNMLFLWIAGDNVEDRLGHVGYLAFYLLAGVVANLGHVMMAAGRAASTPCVGASGAIAGVLGAYMLWFPRRRIRLWYLVFFFMGTVSVPSVYVIGFWFLEQLYLGTSQMAYSAGVAYWAHIGGFIFGALVVFSFKFAKAWDATS